MNLKNLAKKIKEDKKNEEKEQKSGVHCLVCIFGGIFITPKEYEYIKEEIKKIKEKYSNIEKI